MGNGESSPFRRSGSTKRLVLSSMQLTSLDAHTTKLTNRLQELIVSHNEISSLPASKLTQLGALELLDLSSNKIESLPPEIGALQQLREFVISQNRLTVLPPEIRSFTSLTSLDLMANRLVALPKEISYLTSLTKLDVSANMLEELDGSLGELTCLRTLRARANKIKRITNKLNNLQLLESCDLRQNFITKLPKKLVLANLNDLLLSQNELETLPASLTENCTTLVELDVSNNKLSEIPSLGSMALVRRINFEFNKLTKFPDTLLSNMTCLAEVNLCDNNLEELPPEIGYIYTLEILVVARNQLEYLPSSIGNLTRLEVLDVSHNKLVKIPKAIGNVTLLERLNLDYNKLTVIPKQLGQLERLRVLGLGMNELDDNSFKKGCFEGLTSLAELRLFKNKLTELPAQITQLTRLERLFVSSNTLSSLPDSITALIDLKYIHLGDNHFSEFPPQLLKLTKLQAIWLPLNKISSLPSGLTHLENLATLDMSNNKLTSVTNLGEVSSLHELILPRNKLESIPSSFGELRELSCLDISFNTDLTSVPPNLFAFYLQHFKCIYCNISQLPKVDNLDARSISWIAAEGNPVKIPVPTTLQDIVDLWEACDMSSGKQNSGCFYDIDVSEMQGVRPTMEDAFAIKDAYPIAVDDHKFRYLAIYDGHADSRAAEYCASYFPRVLQSEINKALSRRQKNKSADAHTGTPEQEDATSPSKRRKKTEKSGNAVESSSAEKRTKFNDEVTYLVEHMPKIIQDAFTSMRESVFNMEIKSGCTVVSVIAMNNHLWVSNCGDARAVISRKGKAIRCTVDHKATDQNERLRVQELGGFLTQNGRIHGKIAIARAVGDVEFWPLVTSDPYTTYFEITPEYDFIILACDGLWDVISDDDAVALVTEYYNREKTYIGAAVLLRDLGYQLGSYDNISVLVAGLRPVETSSSESSAIASPKSKKLKKSSKLAVADS